jgi:hypothetical protein
VESDGGSDGLGPTVVLQRVAGDRWRQRSIWFECGYVAARGWSWKMSDPGVGRSDSPCLRVLQSLM